MTAWTPELLAEARRLWDEGVSASLVAERLGLTKGQVIGRVHRLGWPSRPPKTTRPGYGLFTRTPKPEPGEMTLIELGRDHCRWPMNSPPKGSAAYLFCGAGKFNGSPYCEQHTRIGMSGSAQKRIPTPAWFPKPVAVR